ncbi:MAG: hypothetical protein IAF94_06020 [Pirellulaceae bacterium]|nr:hypothetical protein [Pirellulaceae bacterium]
MSFSKREIIDFVARLPADCTVSDALEQLCLLEKLERGIEDADNGKVMDHDEFFDELEAEDG